MNVNPQKDQQNILCIEVEGELCFLLNMLLDRKEIKINHARDFSEADTFLQKVHPCLVLLDNRFPENFASDYISHIKNDYPDIKVIVVSGVDAASADGQLQSGADIYLSKPFTKAQLVTSVKSLLN